MKQFVKILLAVIIGLAPVCLAIVFTYFVYQALPNWKGITIAIVLILVAILLAYQVFKSVLHIGPLAFITQVYASPELDNLNKNDQSTTIERSSK